MAKQRKVTRPNLEALAALVARMNWFFARLEAEKQQIRKRAKAPRRAPSARA